MVRLAGKEDYFMRFIRVAGVGPLRKRTGDRRQAVLEECTHSTQFQRLRIAFFRYGTVLDVARERISNSHSGE